MPGPTPGVWQRGKSGWWYTTLKGRQRRLCQGTKKAAQDMLRELLGRPVATANTHRAVADVLDAYLDFMESPAAEIPAGRLKLVTNVCKSFAKDSGHLLVSVVSSAHAKAWLDRNPRWGQSTRAAFMIVIRAAFNWAMRDEVKLVDRQPFGKFRGGTFQRRNFLASESDIDKLLAYPNAAYKDLVTALINTGCRPSEVSRVEACDVDLERKCWVMTRHKNQKKKPSPRIVWLNAGMLALSKRLVKANPEGPIFRSTAGTAWNVSSIKQAFRQMRLVLKLDLKLNSYSLRHEYITRALSSGTDALTVATMCGTSVQVLSKHYSHLMQVPAHMLAAVERAGRKTRQPPPRPS